MPQVCDNIISTLAPCLTQSGMNPDVAQFISILLGVVLVASFPLLLVIFLIWVERKIAARVQDRLGPNRVGPFGLFQNIADAVKLIIKEDITPAGADRLIYNLAPIVAMLSVILIWAVVPFTPYNIGADLDIGVLYFVAISSIGTLAIMMAGWSSNNKYALLGAFRVVAQLVSYEVPMVLALLVPVMLASSMSMQDIAFAQLGMWFIVLTPVSAFIFYVSNLAETGRAPFDLIEAESELVAGYNIEYSGMKFGLFMANEFMHAFTANLLFAVLFMGAWAGPGATSLPILGFIYLMIKTAIVYIPSLILRATVPRVRIDQMMAFNWKFLVPVSIVNVIVMAFVLKLVQVLGLAPSPENASDFLANIPQAAALLLGNVVVIAAAMALIRGSVRKERLSEAAKLAQRVQVEGDKEALPATVAQH
ncbi:MAG: NADH-quinone oxidoreductase subunit H [Chloroflexi bacterium OLB15]|nr:MAG: NADH-quinone oxidoreductase subunit H [Chloroflexi bacterium OLB15]